MERRDQQRKRFSPLGVKTTKHRRHQDSIVLHQNKLQKADQKQNEAKTHRINPEEEEEVNKLEIVEPISQTLNENALLEHKSDTQGTAVSTQTERALHIIIFGATGTMGSYTVLEAVNALNSTYKWGIAGRCNHKLSCVLENVSKLTNVACQDIPTFIVDANSRKALVKLARQCQILINCCAPYEEYAPIIVEACLIAGTHYVDANINARLMQQLHAEFHAKATFEKIYVITACGFISFVNDMAINYIQSNFTAAELQTVESYTQYCRMKSRRLVPLINRATWHGAIAAMVNETDLVCGCTFQKALQLGTTICSCYKFLFARTDAVTGVSIPLTVVDVDMVNASQQLIAENEQRPSVQFKNYLTLPTYFSGFLTLLWCLMLFILAQFPCTRKLLLKFPRLFSLGMCRAACIDKQSADEVIFVTTFKATGVCPSTYTQNELRAAVCGPSPTQAAPKTLQKPNEKVLKLKVCGANPFFGYGCVALLSSAITVLKQTGLPDRGGVFTPGAAFRNTDILKEVSKHNPHFRYHKID